MGEVKALEKKAKQSKGSEATGMAATGPSPLEQKLAQLEEELRGKSGSSGAEAGSGPNGDDDSSGSSGPSVANPINGVTDATILKLIASRMDGSNATSETPGDEQPFEDSKTIAKIAKQIQGVDAKDSEALMAIAKKLAGADSVSGLEKGGIDESDDAKALRKIADVLLKLTGLPGIPTGATGGGATGASGPSADGSGASGSADGKKKKPVSRITLPQDMGKGESG